MKYFSLTNDPDHGKTDDYRKVLRMLSRNGIFVTTAVFCKLKNDNSSLSRHCFKGDTNTLEDTEYRDLMIEAKELGHEIAYHGYSQVSDTRDEFKKGLEIFKNIFGEYPKVYFEHGGHTSFHPADKVKKENLSFSNLGDYGAIGITKQSKFLKDLSTEKDQYVKVVKQLKTNKILKAAITDPDAKQALLDSIRALLTEIEENK